MRRIVSLFFLFEHRYEEIMRIRNLENMRSTRMLGARQASKSIGSTSKMNSDVTVLD